jgi:hypothetical protein
MLNLIQYQKFEYTNSKIDTSQKFVLLEAQWSCATESRLVRSEYLHTNPRREKFKPPPYTILQLQRNIPRSIPRSIPQSIPQSIPPSILRSIQLCLPKRTIPPRSPRSHLSPAASRTSRSTFHLVPPISTRTMAEPSPIPMPDRLS